jgi:putative GTP pyrophosphokinase
VPERPIPKRALRGIDRLVSTYVQNLELVERFRKQVLVAVTDSSELSALVHSFRSRLKDQDHLRNKLIRKWLECRRNGAEFAITPDNVLVTVNDLAGVRILHLHTTQMKAIDGALQAILTEQKYTVLDRFARTWDDESRELFASMGIRTEASATLYTSVHYIIGSNSQTQLTAEIQVRTLMEEVWGEVDHELNYPEPSGSLACREQLKVLARATSTATRLVDSIYRTLDDHNAQQIRKG